VRDGQIMELSGEDGAGKVLAPLRGAIFWEVGLCFLQNVEVRCASHLADRAFQVRINDRYTCPGFLKTAPPEDALLAGVKQHILSMPEQLLSVEDTEFYLALYEDNFPALIKAACLSYSSLQITQVLRHLLKQRVSIRDLSLVLEALVKLRCLHHEEMSRRLQVKGLEAMRLEAEFVKIELRSQITDRLSREVDGKRTIPAFTVTPGVLQALLPDLVDASGAVNLDGRTQSLLFDFATRASSLSASATPVISVPTLAQAWLLQRVLEADFPELIILHDGLIEPPCQLESIALNP
jgi:type III secretory pathway component EscV